MKTTPRVLTCPALAIIRPKVETEITIQDRHPTRKPMPLPPVSPTVAEP
jgi:hypothetical protein